MNRFSVMPFALALLMVVVSPVFAQDIEDLEEEAIRKAVESVAESVIRFETIGGTNRVDGSVVANGPATGVVVSKEGHVLSASFHFAHQPAGIFAQLPNGQRVGAEIIGRDLSRKLVLLKIDSDFKFEVPQVADTASIQVGETVIAVGRVLMPDLPSVSTGIISAKGRVWSRAIQTDAKISPANFGGPLLTLSGKVIGILVPMSPDDDSELAGTEWYDSGIGFAVPMDALQSRLEELKAGKTLRRGLLGVSLKGLDVFADQAVVGFCSGSSPAGKSGMTLGDTIVSINDRPVRRQSEMKHALGGMYENEVARIVVERDGERINFEVKLVGELPPFVPPAFGLLFENGENELKVAQVAESSPSDSAGVKIGDRIRSLDQSPVDNQDDLRLRLAATVIGNEVKITVDRDGQQREVTVEVGKQAASWFKTESPIPAKEAKLIEVKVADSANQCLAIVPELENDEPGLLVWLPQPGKLDRDRVKQDWLDACKKQNMAVLIPQSSSDKAWSPDDIDFVVNAINTLAKRESFDSRRVVVGGAGTGGAMASLLALSQREIFRGLILIDASLSNRVRTFATSPVQPMLVFVGAGDSLDEKQIKTIALLNEAHFPVLVDERKANGATTISLWVDDLLKWSRTVNRF